MMKFSKEVEIVGIVLAAICLPGGIPFALGWLGAKFYSHRRKKLHKIKKACNSCETGRLQDSLVKY